MGLLVRAILISTALVLAQAGSAAQRVHKVHLEKAAKMVYSREAVSEMETLGKKVSQGSPEGASSFLKALRGELGGQAGLAASPHRIRAALLNVLSRGTDEAGFVSVDAIAAIYGTEAADFLRTLLAKTSNGLDLRRVSYRSLLMLANPAVAGAITGQLQAKMPAYEKLAERYPLGDAQIWAAHGHLLKNASDLLKRAERLYTKIYSIDPRVESELLLGGKFIRGSLDRKRIGALRREVIATLSKIPEPDPERITGPRFLLLDDGGTLIKTVAEVIRKYFPRHGPLFAGVEDTAGGRNHLDELPFRVIDLSGSWLKGVYGNLMFAHAIFLRTLAKVEQQESAGIPVPREAAVFGFGPIGRLVAQKLRDAGFTVWVYDRSKAARDLAFDLGFQVDTRAPKRTALAHAHLLVSCTGGNPIGDDDLERVPNFAILVNGGSAKEYQRVRHARQAGLSGKSHLDAHGLLYGALGGREVILGDPQNPGGVDQILITRSGKRQLLDKGGGIVNFIDDAGDADSGNVIPPRYIQLQIGLRHLALREALKGGRAGFAEVPMGLQKEWLGMVEEDLARQGESFNAFQGFLSEREARWKRRGKQSPEVGSPAKRLEHAFSEKTIAYEDAYAIAAGMLKDLLEAQLGKRPSHLGLRVQSIDTGKVPDRITFGLEQVFFGQEQASSGSFPQFELAIALWKEQRGDRVIWVQDPEYRFDRWMPGQRTFLSGHIPRQFSAGTVDPELRLFYRYKEGQVGQVLFAGNATSDRMDMNWASIFIHSTDAGGPSLLAESALSRGESARVVAERLADRIERASNGYYRARLKSLSYGILMDIVRAPGADEPSPKIVQ